MKSLFFIVSRVSHIATARAIAADFSDNQKKSIIIIGKFSGIEKALTASRKDPVWTTVSTSESLIAYLKGFKNPQAEIFMYTDFGMQINYYLYALHKKNRIHVFQDGTASYIPATRKFRVFNYVYSLLMGDGFRVENFVGQSKFISSLYLYDITKFNAVFEWIGSERNRKIKIINESFLSSINLLAEKSYIEKYSFKINNITDPAVLYLPGWNVNPIFVDYIEKNFDGTKFIKAHPADKNDLSDIKGYTSIGSHFVAEQVIFELMSKFNKMVVILESEASSYVFKNTDRIEFYVASMSKDKEVKIRELLLMNQNESTNYS